MSRPGSGAWPTVKLEALCRRITVGHVGPMANEYVESGVPFLRSQNVQPFRISGQNLKYIGSDFHAKLVKSSLSPGDVVVVRTGTPGTACVIPASIPECNCADLVIIRPGEDLNPYFLAAFFNSAIGRARVGGSLVGVAQQHFNITVARNMMVQFPSRIEQDRIASILSAYDDLIENNLRRIQILEEMAQALYREWFAEFRFPGYAAVPKIESRLGTIPEDWSIVKLLDVASVQYGYPFKSRLFSAEPVGPPVVRIRDIPKGQSATHTTEEAGEKFVIRDGDILVGMDGDFHRCIWSGGYAYQNQRVARFRPTRDEVSGCLLHHLMAKPIQDLNMTITGTTVAHLGHKHIKLIDVAIPPADLLRRAGEIMQSFAEGGINLERRNRVLAHTRDLLLPPLLSGELDVSELDIEVVDAA